MHVAIEKGNPKMVEILIAHPNIDINSKIILKNNNFFNEIYKLHRFIQFSYKPIFYDIYQMMFLLYCKHYLLMEL